MTDLILNIKGIEDAQEIEFYVERERAVVYKIKELVKVNTVDGLRFFAYIDSDSVGRGNLMARVVFEDNEGEFTRKVVVSGYTGISIPCMGNGNTIACGSHVISFSKDEDIPENVNTSIFYGTIDDNVSYENITADMVFSLSQRRVESFTEVIEVKRGERIVIAIPKCSELKAYKDDGFNREMEFSTAIMGAIGTELNINNIKYKIYGELSTVDGNLKIHINE